MRAPERRNLSWLLAASAGVLAAVAGLAAAELVAAIVRPEASPLIAVGGAVIDATPTAVKEFAVRTLGTADKPVLLWTIRLVLLAAAAVIGLLARTRRVLGLAGAALFGIVGAVAALSRPTVQPVDVVPSVVGAIVAVATLALLIRPRQPATGILPAPATAATEPAPTPRPVTGRRQFLGTAAAVAAGTALAGGAAALLRRERVGDAVAARAAIQLPSPTDPATPVPAGVAPGFHTANADFYRVDTALTVPRVDVDQWQLRIRGMVDRPTTLNFADLLNQPLTERDITLNCVSNEVGGPYIGTARWLGAPLAPLLRQAGIQAGADQLVARSTDGMTIGTPIEMILDGRDTLLAVGMNGEPLPLEHGFPMRMLTPGLYGYVGACKWVTELTLTRFDQVDPYWVQRGWAATAPVKTASRIDRPAPFTTLDPGPVTIAGVAWAQRRGIDRVELQVDDQPWQPAQLLPVPSIDTWVQWRHTWPATTGTHTLRVRATDRTGDTQNITRATPFPNGATGWHTISVTIR
jgi:DMSO/TMAO reductase YedYZ molybdopterin-dependent catalytic subunit